jgi:hypothetical protein
MWKRKSSDPLGDLLFNRYGLHVLSRPREDVEVFAVFPVSDGKSDAPGKLETFLGGNGFAVPEVRRGEHLADLAGATSDGVSAELALGFLEGFLTLLGAAGIAADLSAACRRKNVRSLRFRFCDASRDRVQDPFALDLALRRHAFDRDASPMRKNYRYYLAVAVHFSSDVSFTALDDSENTVDLRAELPVLAQGHAHLAPSAHRALTVTADRSLAYGVELSELSYNKRRERLELEMTKRYIQVRKDFGELPGQARSIIGGDDDLMLLRVD